jgi:indole-3-pyruvate monooxygenase
MRTALIVGAGPAGLASAACLKRRGIDATVLEAGASVATSWRHHYRRLHLHTVKEHSSLPGLAFGDDVPRYPSREDVVDYLEAYATHFDLAARLSERVTRIADEDGALTVASERSTYHPTAVVIAAGMNRLANPDLLTDQMRFRGGVVHANHFTDGEAYARQRVLVVGAGNTGAEIALDLTEHGVQPTLSVRTPVNVVPRDVLGVPTQVTSIRLRRAPIALGDRVGRWVSRLAFGDLSRHGLTRPSLGPLSSIVLKGRIPVIDVGTIDAIKRGKIIVKPGVERLTETGAIFVDGTSEDFEAVVLATGYRPGLADIIDIPGVLDARGHPKNRKQSGHPGLYFVGYENVSTGLLRQIGLEAEAVAADIATRFARSDR